MEAPPTISRPQIDPGCLPPWKSSPLPEPLPFSLSNCIRTIGPGAILLAGAIGGGEWIVGPLMAVKYGPTILWIVTTAVILQSLFNLEAVRYTLYTGEPIITGFMRLSPGPKLWGTLYLILGAAQLATPALAAGCANVLLAGYISQSPAKEHAWIISTIAIVIILLTALLLQAGKSIERVLERLSWAMIIFIFSFLILVNVLVVPPNIWASTAKGFVTPQALPSNMDIILLALFAATSGSGGLGNLTISNWFRDKGFGMGHYMGGFGSALRGDHAELEPVGHIFPITEESWRRWNLWWRYAVIDQSALWAVGCIAGMFLNVNLVLAIIPAGLEFQGYEAGTYQAKYLAESVWPGLWWLALLNGFWILYSTHLGNTDCLVRVSADILWSASPRWRKISSSRLYAAILVVLTGWALVAVHFGSMLDLFQILGIVANPIMALASLQILRVNTRFLPPEIRPPLWRRCALVVCAVAYGSISVAIVWSKVSSLINSAVV